MVLLTSGENSSLAMQLLMFSLVKAAKKQINTGLVSVCVFVFTRVCVCVCVCVRETVNFRFLCVRVSVQWVRGIQM